MTPTRVAVILTVFAGLKGLLFGYVALVNVGVGRWDLGGLFGLLLALLLVQRAIFFSIWLTSGRWSR
jgi:hypothetical protein